MLDLHLSCLKPRGEVTEADGGEEVGLLPVPGGGQGGGQGHHHRRQDVMG